jgi:hypothetical protein
VAPALMPTADAPMQSLSTVSRPNTVFLNAAAAAVALGGPAPCPNACRLQHGLHTASGAVAGQASAPAAAPLAVMDIGAAQDLFGAAASCPASTCDWPGVDRGSFDAALRADPAGTPTSLSVVQPGDAAEQRISNLSRAYRVNLTVLALVALFTGAFLVFSVLALSVAKRAQQFALLGVLGLSGRERLRLVLAESLVLGVVGSAPAWPWAPGWPGVACGCWVATWAAAFSPAWRPRCSGTRAVRAGSTALLGVPQRSWVAGSRRAPPSNCHQRRHSRDWAGRHIGQAENPGLVWFADQLPAPSRVGSTGVWHSTGSLFR